MRCKLEESTAATVQRISPWFQMAGMIMESRLTTCLWKLPSSTETVKSIMTDFKNEKNKTCTEKAR